MNETQVRKYFIKYGLCLALAHLGLTIFSVSMLLEWKVNSMNKSNQVLQRTVKRMEEVDHTFRSILKMERMKEDYNNQGVKAIEEDL